MNSPSGQRVLLQTQEDWLWIGTSKHGSRLHRLGRFYRWVFIDIKMRLARCGHGETLSSCCQMAAAKYCAD